LQLEREFKVSSTRMLDECYDSTTTDMVYKICDNSKEEDKLGVTESFVGMVRI